MPISVIPSEHFFSTLENISINDLHESIPGELLMANYSFETVTAVHAAQQGLHIELNFHQHPFTNRVCSAFRTVANLRQIARVKTRSRYQLNKNRLLVVWQGRRYAEVEDWENSSKCKGNSKLNQCRGAFVDISRPETNCLSSLFAKMEARVTENCQAKIKALPLQQRALFPGFSNWIVWWRRRTVTTRRQTWVLLTVIEHRSTVTSFVWVP